MSADISTEIRGPWTARLLDIPGPMSRLVVMQPHVQTTKILFSRPAAWVRAYSVNTNRGMWWVMITIKPCAPMLKRSFRSKTHKPIFHWFSRQPTTARAVAGARQRPKTSASRKNWPNFYDPALVHVSLKVRWSREIQYRLINFECSARSWLKGVSRAKSEKTQAESCLNILRKRSATVIMGSNNSD